ncbi:zinc finger protein Xfin-like isoform X2 [Anopheles cruzii]|uniref:zinc finger protein Xfin-like isoform X2 n=1 Tax=Anopheles cruzii TaxID=68878 RepID=UPI0022EC931E|nr:zinc finger protein Xfin-like isoform X2 [Anopheles cruzii]
MEQAAATSKPASPAVSGDEAVVQQQQESEEPPRPCSISKVGQQPPAVAVAARTMAVCRICLASGVRSMVSIHRPIREYTGKTLLSMLLTVCMPLNNRDREADGGGGGQMPESICRSCQWKLLSAYDLYQTTLASDDQLRRRNDQLLEPTLDESHPTIKLEMPDDDDMYDDMYRPEVELTMPSSLQDDTNQMDETGGTAMETGDPGELADESKFSIPDTKESFIDEHYQYEPGSGNHVCGLCSQDFPYKSQCRAHIAAKHNPAKPFKCDTCFCTLTSLQRLQRHKIVAHGEGQVKQQDAIEEQNDCTGDTMYVCPICAKKFASSVRFRRHKSVHAVHKRPFKCDICLYRFPSKSQLTQHAKVHREPTEGQETEAGPLLPCDQCEEMFSGKRLLTIHQRKVHGRPGGRTEDGRERTDYSCIICNESFARESVLNTHMKMHELLAAEKDKEKRLDLERLVKQELQHQMALNVPPLPPLSPEVPDHAHSVLEPFALGLVPVVKETDDGGGDGVEDGAAAQPSTTTFGSINNNSFISFNNNNSRKMATLGAAAAAAKKKIIPTDIAYVCSVCEQEFDEREQLKKHQKRQHRKLKVDIVTTEAPCNGSGVEGPRNLEPPPLTAMPGLELKLMNGSMKRHNQTPDKMDDDLMIIDSEDETKPNDSKTLLSSTPSGSAEGQNASATPGSQIRCELCHKTFTYNCYLTMHMRKNHDESKPYGCKVCHYRFGYRGTLLRHQLIHSSQSVRPGGHGSIIFKCRICSAKFLELMHLNKHLKTHRQPTEPPVAETSGQVQLIRCSECTQIFSDRVQFEEHEQKEHKPKSERGTFRPATTSTAGDHRSSSLSQRMQEAPSASSSPFTSSSSVKNKLNFELKDEQPDDYLTDISIVKVEPVAN